MIKSTVKETNIQEKIVLEANERRQESKHRLPENNN